MICMHINVWISLISKVYQYGASKTQTVGVIPLCAPVLLFHDDGDIYPLMCVFNNQPLPMGDLASQCTYLSVMSPLLKPICGVCRSFSPIFLKGEIEEKLFFIFLKLIFNCPSIPIRSIEALWETYFKYHVPCARHIHRFAFS